MIEQGLGFYIISVLIMVLLLVATIIIPFYGFILKRWKGLVIGCLIQPIICAIICVTVVIFISLFQTYHLREHREAAMVTVKKADTEGHSHFWYIKDNEECYYEYKESDAEDSEYNGFHRSRLFDVLPLDSFSVCVDDKIVVSFDLNSHKVTAAEYDEPMEIVNVNWEKVNGYFKNRH